MPTRKIKKLIRYDEEDLDKLEDLNLAPNQLGVLTEDGEAKAVEVLPQSEIKIAKQKRGSKKIKKDGTEPEETSEKKVSTELLHETKRYEALLIISALATFGFIISALVLYTQAIEIGWIICTIGAGSSAILGVVLAIIKQQRENREKGRERFQWFKDLTGDEQRSFFLSLVVGVLVALLLIFGFFFDYPRDLIGWGMIIIIEVRIVVFMVVRLRDYKADPTKYQSQFNEQVFKSLETTEQKAFLRAFLRERSFNPRFYVLQCALFIVAIIFVIHLILGNDIIAPLGLPYINSINSQLAIVAIIVSLSGIASLWQVRMENRTKISLLPKYIDKNDLDWDKTGLIRYAFQLIMPTLMMIFLPISKSANIEAGIIQGAVSGYNYFQGIYLVIINDPTTQAVMGIVIISALTILVGKARGRSGTGTMVIGALGIAGVPMIVTIMAFMGQVPAPEEFYTLFGSGFGNLIYSISFTSIIALALSLIGVFYEIVPAAVTGSGGYN